MELDFVQINTLMSNLKFLKGVDTKVVIRYVRDHPTDRAEQMAVSTNTAHLKVKDILRRLEVLGILTKTSISGPSFYKLNEEGIKKWNEYLGQFPKESNQQEKLNF